MLIPEVRCLSAWLASGSRRGRLLLLSLDENSGSEKLPFVPSSPTERRDLPTHKETPCDVFIIRLPSAGVYLPAREGQFSPQVLDGEGDTEEPPGTYYILNICSRYISLISISYIV